MEQILGLAGVPFVRLAIKQLGLTGWVALIASQVLAIGINVAIAVIDKGDLGFAIAMGVIVGVLSNFYNDLKS